MGRSAAQADARAVAAEGRFRFNERTSAGGAAEVSNAPLTVIDTGPHQAAEQPYPAVGGCDPNGRVDRENPGEEPCSAAQE
jgi:hypothetical protein